MLRLLLRDVRGRFGVRVVRGVPAAPGGACGAAAPGAGAWGGGNPGMSCA